MLPKLYSKSSASAAAMTFLGTINHCRKCEVTEVRNGSYTLTLETTINDDCADILVSQKIIGAKANPFDGIQYFEIQTTKRSIDGIIKAEAKHIKNYCFQHCSEGDLGYAGSVTVINDTPKNIWTKLIKEYIKTSVPFTFTSNITTKADYSLGLDTPETLGNILGGKDGSFLDVWGGEFHWDNYKIELLGARGSKKDYQIRYGTNISDAEQTETCTGTYSHILPYGKIALGDRKINFFAPIFEIPDHQCSTTKVYMLDCTDFLDDYSVGEFGARYEETKKLMTNYAKRYARRNNLGKLQVSIEITLRAELDDMAQIGLCDTVKVVLDNFGTTANAKITQVTYNSLLERWEKLVIGESAVTVADLILNKRRYVN